MIYKYAWGNNPKRALMRGRKCVLKAMGKMNTVLVQFVDNGQQETTSRQALRRTGLKIIKVATGEDRCYKACECFLCGTTRTCVPGFDYYTTAEHGHNLLCATCFKEYCRNKLQGA